MSEQYNPEGKSRIFLYDADEVVEALDKIADVRGVTRSAVIRDALRIIIRRSEREFQQRFLERNKPA